MLIAQDPNRSATTQQLNGFLKTILAIEHFNSGAPPQSSHVLVDETVTEFLVNRTVSHVADKFWQELRAQLPVAEVT